MSEKTICNHECAKCTEGELALVRDLSGELNAWFECRKQDAEWQGRWFAKGYEKGVKRDEVG